MPFTRHPFAFIFCCTTVSLACNSPGGSNLALISVNVEEKYHDSIVHVSGTRGQKKKLFLFTISTCMWCKLGKRWLNDRGFAYSYLDIDKIPVDEKNRIKQELGRLMGETPSFPFLIIDGREWHSGYVSFIWEELLGE